MAAVFRTVRVAPVFRERRRNPVLVPPVGQHGRSGLSYDLIAAVRPDPVQAGVFGLFDDVVDGCDGPQKGARTGAPYVGSGPVGPSTFFLASVSASLPTPALVLPAVLLSLLLTPLLTVLFPIFFPVLLAVLFPVLPTST